MESNEHVSLWVSGVHNVHSGSTQAVAVNIGPVLPFRTISTKFAHFDAGSAERALNSGDDQADPESDFPNFGLLFAISWKIYRESTGKPCAHRERARRELSKTFEILKIGPVALEKSSFKHRNKIGKF